MHRTLFSRRSFPSPSRLFASSSPFSRTTMYGMNDNQNVYMDGKRTTSRVSNEPGGKSTVNLGWDSPKGEKRRWYFARCDSDHRSCLMFFFKFVRPTRRPAIFLGTRTPPAKAPKERPAKKDENPLKVEGLSAPKRKMSDRSTGVGGGGGGGIVPTTTLSSSTTITTSTDSSRNISNTPSRGVSSNAYANGASQNTGNVITDRPTSRVTQPPGGVSSISFC